MRLPKVEAWIVGLFMVTCIIGSVMEATKAPPVKEPWRPRVEEGPIQRTRKTVYRYRERYPWYRDEREGTLRYYDFKEDLEEKGIMIDEWDALEIWDKYYE